MFVRGYITTIPDNNAVPNGTTGEIRRDIDNSLIATVSTVGGWFEYFQNGFPGQFHLTWNFTGTVREQYSKIVGPSGPVDVAGIPYTLRTLQDGVIEGVGANMPVSGTGAGMSVTVGTGYAVVHGILYDQRTLQTVPVAAAHATLGRLDRVVIEVSPAGVAGTDEGKSTLRVLTGTAAATPALPLLTQTDTLYQYPLATITVGAATPVITSGNVASVAGFTAPKIYPGTVTQVMLQGGAITTPWLADLSVTDVKLGPLAVTAPKIADLAVTTAKLADLGVTAAKIGLLAVTDAKLIDSAVTAAKIAPLAVTTAKLADLGVTTPKLADASVTELKLATSAVSSIKIAPLAVTDVKIAALAVTTAKLAASAVTDVKLIDSAVTTAKVAPLAITTAKIADLAVTNAKLADSSVTTAKIAAGAVDLADLSTYMIDRIGYTTARTTDIDVSTTTMTSVGLGITITANENWVIEYNLGIGSDSASGIMFEFDLPGASDVRGVDNRFQALFMGTGSSTLEPRTAVLTTTNVSSPAFCTAVTANGVLRIVVRVLNYTSGGPAILRFAPVAVGATATIYAHSYAAWRRTDP